MIEQEPVKEHLIGVLQGAQKDVPLEVVVFAPVSLVGPHRLLVEALDGRREKSVQAKSAPFFVREGGAFIQIRSLEDCDAREAVRR
jgi:hypothetical protein